MTNSPKNQPTFHINQVGQINSGDVTIQRDQVGIQYNYATDPEVKTALTELQTALTNLQAKHPTVNTETEALAIIDAEFTEIKQNKTHPLATLRKQLLNRDRQFQALKTALIEAAKHYQENSAWGKGAIAYLETLSSHPDET